MQIVRKETDPLNITLELTLEPGDYSGKFKEEIKKIRNKSQIKGFRKGMTPDSVIKKMYGKAILLDTLNETLQDKLFEYIDEEKINYLGQPLPHAEDQANVDLDVNELKTYKFSFDLGLAPELTITGVSETDEYNFYDVEIPEKLVDDELNAARRRFGKHISATDDIQENDMLTLDAIEMEDGKEKPGGWTTEFNILVNVIKDEAVKNELLTKKAEDTIVFDIYKLEDKDHDYVNKYILKKTEGDDAETGNMFSAYIKEVSRVEPAELNQEFFDTFGEEDIKDEASLRDFLRNDLKKYFDHQAEQYMYRDIMDHLMEHNSVALPESFLKRYLKETNDKITEEQIDDEFEAFAKNLQWSLQKNHLAKKYELKVDENDIKKHFTNRVFSYLRSYGNMDYSFISKTVERLMQDKEQVNQAYEEILATRVFDRIGEIVKRRHLPISHDDFVQKVSELNKRVNNF